MRRAVFAITLGLAFASCVLPQEAPPAGRESKTEQSEPGLGWKWANFALLVLGLGYLIGKNVPALFRKQSDEIQAALSEAAKIKQDAAAYAAGVEARLGGLQKEIANLRETARAEMTAEGERIHRETAHHLQRIQEQSSQEIALITRAAKDDLRKYAADLAVGLAEQRVRARMTPATQEKLVNEFVHDLHDRAGRRVN